MMMVPGTENLFGRRPVWQGLEVAAAFKKGEGDTHRGAGDGGGNQHPGSRTRAPRPYLWAAHRPRDPWCEEANGATA